ncbi:MAG: toprim domain-containing protein [Rickettsiales bacterium]|nr:toprim domain-containing protein [Pseudomonadota bacterium]MDA0965692.1 toprim domain-containing protein [Pseudomonadota bacterium]MDG4543016.1 toprim domain-containing protein [Rickettsiales bacterium]MDG4544536.1 toprim domain-containing protein [Rickettsiales bacterium]MDG4546658.1 toprim domain-containing protein [Rickettsiales bacterium]
MGSFKVNLVSCEWSDFATGDAGGDLVSLYAYLKGISQYQAARELLGNAKNIIPFAPKVPKAPKVNENSLSDYVGKIWRGCGGDNSIVAAYLKSRGITGAIPPTIKEHSSLYHKPSNSKHPAMVAAVTIWPNKTILGLHRTYIKPDGSGKANIEPNKMMLGSVKGGAVRLSKPSSKLILAEGIETALSVAMSTGLSTWATLSTSGMLNVEVPPLEITQKIIIAADNDKAGIGAANKLADRLLSAGYRVQIAMPPEGMDFNDLLQGQNNE